MKTLNYLEIEGSAMRRRQNPATVCQLYFSPPVLSFLERGGFRYFLNALYVLIIAYTSLKIWNKYLFA